MTNKPAAKIAVIGGGFSGVSAAKELLDNQDVNAVVHIFDQGGRGPGGRSSHRRIKVCEQESGSCITGIVIPDDDRINPNDSEVLDFDHGCQFFRVESEEFKNEYVNKWINKGFAAKWNGKFLNTKSKSNDLNDEILFFGFSSKCEMYCGVGGMHTICRKIVSECEEVYCKENKFKCFRATRVKDILRKKKQYELFATTGKAALHDTAESESKILENTVSLGLFDGIIITDASASFENWHRASCGIRRIGGDFVNEVSKRPRVPLFTCMVAFEKPISSIDFDYDGISFDLGKGAKENNNILWFACCNGSKPGFSDKRCWTLVSTPEYCINEIQRETMQDKITGEFKPQTNEYLNGPLGPSQTMFKAFQNQVKKITGNTNFLFPKVIYIQSQRWGSAFPSPLPIHKSHLREILGVTYNLLPRLQKIEKTEESYRERQQWKDFVVHDEQLLYYAGDYCSSRQPGPEAAVLSGVAAARDLITRIDGYYDDTGKRKL